MTDVPVVGFSVRSRTEIELIDLHTRRVRSLFETIVTRVMVQTNALLLQEQKKPIVAVGRPILISTNESELDGVGKHTQLEKRTIVNAAISGVFSVPCSGEIRYWKRFVPFAWETLVAKIDLPYQASIDAVKNLQFENHVLPVASPVTISLALPEETKAQVLAELGKDELFLGAVRKLTARDAQFI